MHPGSGSLGVSIAFFVPTSHCTTNGCTPKRIPSELDWSPIGNIGRTKSASITRCRLFRGLPTPVGKRSACPTMSLFFLADGRRRSFDSPDQLCLKFRNSFRAKLAARRPRLRRNRHGPASTKYVRRMLSRVFTSGPTGSAECQVLSATAKA